MPSRAKSKTVTSFNVKTCKMVRVVPASTVGEIFLWNNPADREALQLSLIGKVVGH